MRGTAAILIRPMPEHIGIVACSAEGAALCYRTICVEGAELLGPHAHPEVTMHTPSLAEYMNCIYRDDWQGVGDLMLASADKLAKIGADFLICPDNTIHQAMPYVVPRSPLPWLHIAEIVAARAVIGRMKEEGCDAVVLGCTEIPLLMNDANSPLPTLDSTRLLARAALRRAVTTDRA
jgi:aspartate/glutamate racemase